MSLAWRRSSATLRCRKPRRGVPSSVVAPKRCPGRGVDNGAAGNPPWEAPATAQIPRSRQVGLFLLYVILTSRPAWIYHQSPVSIGCRRNRSESRRCQDGRAGRHHHSLKQLRRRDERSVVAPAHCGRDHRPTDSAPTTLGAEGAEPVPATILSMRGLLRRCRRKPRRDAWWHPFAPGPQGGATHLFSPPSQSRR